MQEFTGWQYLLIDAANQYGLDKKLFEERIAWAEENLDRLEALAAERDWKEKPLFIKATQAIRKAQRGEPTGHRVGFDAVCSGMQIMSAITGCLSGGKATGLVDPDRRADAYTDCSTIMSDILGTEIPNQRDKLKNAVMTSLYGSKKEPKIEFGEDTPELDAFYQAMYTMAPGACELLQALLASWRPYAKAHMWKLPDGYDAYCPVMVTQQARVSVPEMETKLTYQWVENVGEPKGVKNAANVIHSIDAYVLRSLIRRCSYDKDVVSKAEKLITAELLERFGSNKTEEIPDKPDEATVYYIEQYHRSGMADIVILPWLTVCTVRYLTSEHLLALAAILSTLVHEPFDILTVHDEFTCHPNNMNHLRKHYRNILAELSESNIANDILSQVFGTKFARFRNNPTLTTAIRSSNYALA